MYNAKEKTINTNQKYIFSLIVYHQQLKRSYTVLSNFSHTLHFITHPTIHPQSHIYLLHTYHTHHHTHTHTLTLLPRFSWLVIVSRVMQLPTPVHQTSAILRGLGRHGYDSPLQIQAQYQRSIRRDLTAGKKT